jgi:hypothetical protein
VGVRTLVLWVLLHSGHERPENQVRSG